MILGTGQFLLWLLLGVALVGRFWIDATPAERLAGGFVVGPMMGAAVALAGTCLLGYNAGLPAAALVCALATAAAWLHGRGPSSPDQEARQRLAAWSAITIVSVGVLGWLFWTHMLWGRSGGYVSGGGTWGDIALHMSLTTRFAAQERFTWDLPIYEGAPLTYPFLVDFMSGVLVRAGWGLRESLLVPGFLLALASVQLLFAVAFRWLRSGSAALLATLVFFLNGSPAGLLYMWRDWRASGDSLPAFLGHLPQDYAHLTDHNLHFTNIVVSYVLPQRGILLGLPAFLLISLFLRRAWDAPQGGRARHLSAAAVILALLPLAHIHTFFVVLGVWIWLMAGAWLRDRRAPTEWIAALAAGLVVAAPQVVWLLSGAVGRGFSHWYVGWMRAPNESIGAFWLRNMGLGVPLMLVLLVPLWARRRQEPFLAHWYTALVCLFVVTNLYIFQPHAFDNMKFMIYSYLALAIATGWLLAAWFRGHVMGRVLAAVVLASLTAAGALSIAREGQTAWPFLGREEIALARDFVKEVPTEARVLTSDQHNHFVPTLTGRRIVMGYRGWLWTYGINYSGRERDVQAMYSGGPEAESLISRYGISYVVVGPSERSDWKANTDFFDSRYPVALRSENYKVYDVRSIHRAAGHR